MERTNYFKILWIALFVVFAGFSCWATAESLCFLFSSFPRPAIWAVTIGVFVVASIGTKLIVDSLNQNIYLGNRGLRLFGGILLVIVFWLIFSLPTNTHTFFYRSTIQTEVQNDILKTRSYLGQVINNTKNTDALEPIIADFKGKINSALQDLKSEIMTETNPGFGPNAKRRLQAIADILGVAEVAPISFRGTSRQDRERLCIEYHKKVEALANAKIENLKSSIIRPNEANLQAAKVADKNLASLSSYINDGTVDLFEPKDMTEENGVCPLLNRGYNAVKVNKDFVKFEPTDESKYTAEKPVTEVERMLSVYDVMVDFIDGKFAGKGFGFMIMISLIIDIAAFIFFDLAFCKKED